MKPLNIDNMTIDELKKAIIDCGYMKCINASDDFTSGLWYYVEQTGNNELLVRGDTEIHYITFSEADSLFK